jgi:hypothetical protein
MIYIFPITSVSEICICITLQQFAVDYIFSSHYKFLFHYFTAFHVSLIPLKKGRALLVVNVHHLTVY